MSFDQPKTAEGLAAVSARSAAALRNMATKTASLQDENEQLRAKVASYERADRVRSLAKEMEEKGLSPELTFDEKVASVARYADLEQVGHAIKLAGGGKLNLADVSDDSPKRDNAASSFEAFCLTGSS